MHLSRIHASILLLISLFVSPAFAGKPGQYIPNPTVSIFGLNGQGEGLSFPSETSTVTRAMVVPPGGAWLHGTGYIPCGQTTGFAATVVPQLGEYTPLFLAGDEGCYQSFACPWCWRLLWGGSERPRYEQFDSYRKRIFVPEGATTIMVQPIGASSVNTSVQLLLGQWNCDALESLQLSQAVDSATPQILPDAEAADRVFVVGADDAVPLLLRFFNANKVEEYSVCPGTKIEYSWDGGTRKLLMESGSTPALFTANVPVPLLKTGTHTITVYATPKGTARTYTASTTVKVYSQSLFIDADERFDPANPSDDLPQFVPGSELSTGASVLITQAEGQLVTLNILSTAAGKVRVELASVSRYPGIAMNYPTTGAVNTPDMDFGAGTTYVDLPVAKGVKWVSTPLYIRDYAASAKLKVTIPLRTGSYSYTVTIPTDRNKNSLPDAGWRAGSSAITDFGMDPGWDEDNDPEMRATLPPIGPDQGGTVGDNLTDFEEYRGFVLRGSHRRTNPFRKDFFVEIDAFDGDILYAYPALPTATHVVSSTDLTESAVVNSNATGLPGAGKLWPNGHRDQKAHRVLRGEFDPLGTGLASTNLGLTDGVNTPAVPNTAFPSEIFVGEIESVRAELGGTEAQALELRRGTVAHECGHSVNLYENPTPECLMFGGSFTRNQTFAIIPTAFCAAVPETYLIRTLFGPMETIPARFLERCTECPTEGIHVLNFEETDTLRLKELR